MQLSYRVTLKLLLETRDSAHIKQILSPPDFLQMSPDRFRPGPNDYIHLVSSIS